jgi:hypothetical protein
MAKPSKPAGDAKLLGEIDFYIEMVDLHDHLPINVGLRSAQEATMISSLGSPQLPLTKHDQPERASPLVKALSRTEKVSAHVTVTGIKPALKSLREILQRAFDNEKAAGHDLESVLGTAGMRNVRLRNPTTGTSTKISNHAWGTAIDFKILGHSAPANTGDKIPRFIAALLPAFNGAGWFSGIGFHDTMHFEVSDGLIQKWAKDGSFKP